MLIQKDLQSTTPKCRTILKSIIPLTNVKNGELDRTLRIKTYFEKTQGTMNSGQLWGEVPGSSSRKEVLFFILYFSIQFI